MDRGTEGLDAGYRGLQDLIDETLVARGWKRDVDWVSLVKEGAAHDELAWAERLATPLEFLFGK